MVWLQQGLHVGLDQWQSQNRPGERAAHGNDQPLQASRARRDRLPQEMMLHGSPVGVATHGNGCMLSSEYNGYRCYS